ncbi:Fibronectin type III,Immunoglobulin subtype,Immunoglobulin-like domain,Immunoglobulin-like [Cinara cedri]|uniref:Fibronectin type III,Immunoglobulin subtype,Immunoglobulin-like domain,Immunoglobulin-like n=1 Tax=Cinara cedri TaxID=506608 RepID=A0A5E4MEW5_9HEMI|nr:Fibronectin type III,Immunoglobulin subtype,Immunoglobulin-like domain,Immunoglobulin-like [Cinara cedri]
MLSTCRTVVVCDERRGSQPEDSAAADSYRKKKCSTTEPLQPSRGGEFAERTATVSGRCSDGDRETAERSTGVTGKRDGVVRSGRIAAVRDAPGSEIGACRVYPTAGDKAADENEYHPVRRRIVANGKSGDETAAATEIQSYVPHNGRRQNNEDRPLRKWLFASYQHHHYRGHRNHHHLHMWTSSCCWWLLVLYAAVVVVASFARAAHSAKDVPVYHVRAVAGQQARLPCDISLVTDEEDPSSDPGADSAALDGESSLASGVSRNQRDAVLLVLWYRDDLGTPIYSVDARSSATHNHQQDDLMTTGAERWSDRQVFGERAHFHVNEVGSEGDSKKSKETDGDGDQKKSIVSTYYSSELRIDRVSVKDAIHLYRCRVDFRLAQTRNSKVNLTVIVPPDRMEITDLATGRQLLQRKDNDGANNKKDRGPEASSTTVVGPYVEGSDVHVRCRVYGGKPRPRVAWFRDNRLLKPESDDPEDMTGTQQQGAVAAVDGYATASVTSSSSTSTGGENSEEVVEVDLTLAGLTRSDLHTELTCRAWNYFYVDDEYSITVTNSGTSNIDTTIEKEQIGVEVDPGHWTPRQRQASLTAVAHVDMNFPPLTVQILPITDNGRFNDDDLQPPPFTQSSAKISPSSDGGDHLAVQSSKIHEKSQLQPLTAGRKYKLPCRAYGSRPPAKLTWWMDGRRLDNTHETTSSDGNSTTSVLSFTPTKPDKPGYHNDGNENGSPDYDGRLTCRAENPQHQLQKSTSQRKHTAIEATGSGADPPDDDAAGSQFIQSTWLLRIQYVPYTQIKLGTSLLANDIREGTDVYFDCTVDAVPPAYKVQWKRDGKELHHNTGGGSSGSGLTTTIIISNQSLVLQGVSRHETGHYTCGAENAEGPGPHSAPIYLDVLYAPTCAPSGSSKSAQRVVYGVAKKETVTIACHVQANPLPTEYRWSFNNTISSIANTAGAGSSGSMMKQRFNGIGTLAGSSLNSSKTLTYAPRTDFDYGTVECWARNRVGMQSSPCVYHVIAAGRPDRVTNCTVINSRAGMIYNGTRRSRSSRNAGSHIFIRCTEGYDGGLTQHLWAEIREASKIHRSDLDVDDLGGDLVLNVTGIDEQDRQDFSNLDLDENKKGPANSASPPVKVFVARGLKPGAVYRIDVMASNAKGRSEPLTLMVSIPKGSAGTDTNESNQNGISNTMTTIDGQDPDRARNLLLEQQREQERDRRMQENGGLQGEFRMTPAMIIVLGVAGSLVVIACGAATYLRYHRDDDDEDQEQRDRAQNGADGTVVECDGALSKTVTAADEASQTAAGPGRGAAQPDNAVPNIIGHKKQIDKEYLYRTGRQTMQVGPSSSEQSVRYGSDVSVGPSVTFIPSPTSVLRGTNASNVYVGAASTQHCKGTQHQQTDKPGLQGRAPSQSYHCRNPDIIPAPLQQMSPGAVYNNYKEHGGDSADSMTLIVASSTSSSPIHNHRQMVHQQQHNRGYNNRGGQYHQGVMTLRRPVVINNQYYGGGGGGGTLQRNVLQQPDASGPPIVMVKDASVGPVSYHPQATSAYCTLPRASYHQHHHHQHSSHQHYPQQHKQQQQSQQVPMMHNHNYRETDASETPPPPPPPPWPSHGGGAYPTVIVVPSPPYPSSPGATAAIVAGTVPTAAADAKPLQQTTVVSNKRESAV